MANTFPGPKFFLVLGKQLNISTSGWNSKFTLNCFSFIIVLPIVHKVELVNSPYKDFSAA